MKQLQKTVLCPKYLHATNQCLQDRLLGYPVSHGIIPVFKNNR